MNKNTLIILGVGVAAFFLLTSMRKKRRGEVFVESPEKITEEEFGTPAESPMEETIKDIATGGAATIINKIKQKREQKKAYSQVRTPWGTATIDLNKAKKIAKQKERQKRKAARQQKRTERRSRRKRKVGEIDVLF